MVSLTGCSGVAGILSHLSKYLLLYADVIRLHYLIRHRERTVNLTEAEADSPGQTAKVFLVVTELFGVLSFRSCPMTVTVFRISFSNLPPPPLPTERGVNPTASAKRYIVV